MPLPTQAAEGATVGVIWPLRLAGDRGAGGAADTRPFAPHAAQGRHGGAAAGRRAASQTLSSPLPDVSAGQCKACKFEMPRDTRMATLADSL